MAQEKKLPKFWFHVLGLLGTCFVFLPIWGFAALVYLTGLVLYYGYRWAAAGIGYGWKHGYRGYVSLFCISCIPALLGMILSYIGLEPAAGSRSYALMETWPTGFEDQVRNNEIVRAAFAFATGLMILPIVFAPLAVLWYVLQLPAKAVTRQRTERLQAESQRRYEEERRQRVEQEQLHVEAKQRQGLDHRRRIEARAACELLFGLHAVDIGKRFTRAMLDDFMGKYMSDSHNADDVERRGKELQRLIEQHCQAVKPQKNPRTIQELANWFVNEKQRIDGLPVDEEIKEEHLLQLNTRYSELSQELLQRMEP